MDLDDIAKLRRDVNGLRADVDKLLSAVAPASETAAPVTDNSAVAALRTEIVWLLDDMMGAVMKVQNDVGALGGRFAVLETRVDGAPSPQPGG